MGLKLKQKADMMSRLFQVYNNTKCNQDICLSVIAMCMLFHTSTDEDLTRRSPRFQNQFCKQDDQARSSEQKP